MHLLDELQAAGAIGFEIDSDPKTQHDVIFLLRQQELSEEIRDKLKRTGEILKLDPDRKEFKVVYAPFRSDDDTLTIQTRSVLQMLIAMSGFVNVPPELAHHASKGYDLSRVKFVPFHVYSSSDRPDEAFASFRYNDYWYWIEHSDLQSKQVFALMMFLTTLTSSGTGKDQPVLTIPTN